MHLVDPDRVAVLQELGLTATADPDMERFARRVRDQIGVPIALVSLVEPGRQVFPGMCGLPDPLAQLRATPLDASFCKHVVESAQPLVISDAREHPLVCDNLAVTEFGMLAYAGIPLTDDHGHVLGSLCAIDLEVRHWTDDELGVLSDLARDCRNQLRLRLSRLDAEREREGFQLQIDRSRRMLALAELFNETRSVLGVRARVARLADAIPGLSTATLHTADEIHLQSPRLSPAVLRCLRENVTVHHADLHTHLHTEDDTATAALGRHHADDGVRAVVCSPVTGSSGLLGVIEMLWPVPHPLDDQEHTMTATLSSYVGQALERAQLIEHRTGVAHELQAAMLTTLPEVPELPMAACYVPANSEEWVGGDWYDAIVLPAADTTQDRDLAVAVTVGDVTGHDIPAAALMGQARAMLRQAAFDFPGLGPAEVFTHFENACAALDVAARGSAALAFLERSRSCGEWTMTWTSAGHPPPLLALREGTVRRLELSAEDQGMLFGYRDVYDAVRVDSRVVLPPGSTVLFYSDGVIEVPGANLEGLLDELGDLLVAEHAKGPAAVVDAVSMHFGSGSDDVVALAVHIPHEES